MARLPLLYRREIWVDLLLYPGHTLPTAAAPVVVAAGLAVHDHVFAPVPLTLAFLGSWFIHIGGVLTDNYELLRGHPHVPEHPELSVSTPPIWMNQLPRNASVSGTGAKT